MSDSYQTPFPGGGGFPGAPGGGFPGAGAAPGGFPQAAPGGGFGPAGVPAPRPQAPAQPVAAKAAPAKAEGRAKRGAQKKADKPEKVPTKRVISRQFTIAGIFALVVGGGAFFVLTDSGDQTYVVRATSEIAAGSAVSGGMLEAALLPQVAVEDGALTGATAEEALKKAQDELDGLVTQFPVPAKSQLQVAEFGLQANLGEALAPTERLVSINATVGTSVAGGLSAGDRVDIIGAVDGWTRVVAYNVPITSITVSEDLYNNVADQQTADKDVRPEEALPGDPVPGIYVVRVPADLAPTLLNWNTSGTLHLAYRGVDSVDVVVPDNYLDTDGVQQETPIIP